MKIICVGQNYRKHNIEMGREPEGQLEDPIIFLKQDSALMTEKPLNF